MRRHATDNLFSGGFHVHLLAGGETGHALVFSARDDDEPIEAFGRTGLEQQCRFDDRNRVRILHADGVHPFVLAANDDGMHDAVELVDAGGAFALVFASGPKRRFGQFGAIDAAVWVENLAAEMPDYFVVNGLARLHEPVGDAIGLNKPRAQRDEHLSDYRLPDSNASGEADFQHEAPECDVTAEALSHIENKG